MAKSITPAAIEILASLGVTDSIKSEPAQLQTVRVFPSVKNTDGRYKSLHLINSEARAELAGQEVYQVAYVSDPTSPLNDRGYQDIIFSARSEEPLGVYDGSDKAFEVMRDLSLESAKALNAQEETFAEGWVALT